MPRFPQNPNSPPPRGRACHHELADEDLHRRKAGTASSSAGFKAPGDQGMAGGGRMTVHRIEPPILLLEMPCDCGHIHKDRAMPPGDGVQSLRQGKGIDSGPRTGGKSSLGMKRTMKGTPARCA